MKISPLKDYKTPKYAARIAALVAFTAAASGCVQNAGAAMTTEGDTHTSVSDNATALAGDVEAIEETTTQTCEPHTEGTVVTTTTEEIECTQLEGDVAVPDETTAILGAGSIFSAIGVIKDKLFGTGQPELMGDVPNIEDPDTEPEIMGKIPAYTEEPVVEGVIEAPECIDKPEQPEPPVSEGVVPAITDDYPELEGDVPAYSEDRDPMTDFVDEALPIFEKVFGKDFYAVTSNEEMYYRSYEIDDVLFETRSYLNFGNGKDKVIYIAFFVRGSEFDRCLSADKNSTKVGDGFILDFDKSGKNMLLFVPYDYYTEPLKQSEVEDIANDLKDKGFMK